MREFRRQTDSVRNVVEREFYKMDQDVTADDGPRPLPANGVVAQGAPDALPPVTEDLRSQITAGMDESDPDHPDYHKAQPQPAEPAPVVAPTENAPVPVAAPLAAAPEPAPAAPQEPDKKAS
jgi:sec-independent protein translocase protein TatB